MYGDIKSFVQNVQNENNLANIKRIGELETQVTTLENTVKQKSIDLTDMQLQAETMPLSKQI